MRSNKNHIFVAYFEGAGVGREEGIKVLGSAELFRVFPESNILDPEVFGPFCVGRGGPGAGVFSNTEKTVEGNDGKLAGCLLQGGAGSCVVEEG